MDLVFWIITSLAGIVIILVIIGFLSPRFAKMQRTVTVKASASAIFPKLNNMQEFVKWSPWTDKDPDAKHTYSGPESGLGCKYDWVGDKKKVGSGSMEIIESIENKRVNSTLKFHGRSDAEAGWTIVDNGESCEVTWDFKGDMGSNPAGRLMGRMMDKFLGPDYQKGLENLKESCENA
ncbi:MAG: hypothetical protein ACI9J3_002852 [Parvicellaceae bacterium]|jgi:hypothetical protein